MNNNQVKRRAYRQSTDDISNNRDISTAIGGDKIAKANDKNANTDTIDNIVNVSAVLSAGLILICSVIAIVSLFQYFEQFSNDRIAPNGSVALWNSYSGAVMPMVQTIVSIVTLIAAVWLGRTFSREVDARRQLVETNRELTRLSEMMVDRDFYKNITQPSWEIALRWFNLEGPSGDEYRAKIVCEFIELPKRAHVEWLHEDIKDQAYSPEGKSGQFSDYMVLAIWTRFWSNIVFLEQEKIISSDGIRKLFYEWFRWWSPFMFEYIEVVISCAECCGQRISDDHSLIRIKELQSRILNLVHFDKTKENIIIKNHVTKTMDIIKGVIDKYGDKRNSDPW